MNPFTFKTKPREDQLSFLADCYRCAGELTITNGKPDRHDCREPRPVALADIRAALEAKNNR